MSLTGLASANSRLKGLPGTGHTSANASDHQAPVGWSMREAIEQHPGLTFVEKESQTIGCFGRNDRFEYVQRFAGAGDIRNRVFVEAGTASGREPTACVRLQSYVGQFLQESGVSLGAEDEGPFEMRLLHFRRTFVEKMFAIHAKVEAFKKGGKEIGGYSRHYYDM